MKRRDKMKEVILKGIRNISYKYAVVESNKIICAFIFGQKKHPDALKKLKEK